MGLRQEII